MSDESTHTENSDNITTNKDDTLMGTDGNDMLVGGPGNDVIFGKDGDDRLVGGAGDDHLIGGNGDDDIIGSAGDDCINAGAGNDVVNGSAGADTVVHFVDENQGFYDYYQNSGTSVQNDGQDKLVLVFSDDDYLKITSPINIMETDFAAAKKNGVVFDFSQYNPQLSSLLGYEKTLDIDTKGFEKLEVINTTEAQARANCGEECYGTPNHAPVAANDSYTTNEDMPLVIAAVGVLGNDSDADGNALTSIISTGPSHGTVTLGADGNFVYTPNANFNGTDSFTYIANDGTANSNIATVTITVCGVNDAPVACDDVTSIKEDTAPNPVTGNVLANDINPDGDTLTVTNAGIITLNYGVLELNTDGSYTYTLNNSNPAVNALNDGQTLTDSFTYNISDGQGGTASAYLNVTINGTTDVPTCGCHCSSTPPGTPPGDYSTVKTTAGTFFADTLTGDSGVTNLFYSLGGNDNITGANEAINRIFTGSGNDTVVGGKNAVNEIYTEKGGIDDIKGGFHSINTLYGGIDANKLTGGDCSINTIFGGEGDATIHGGNNNSVNTMYAGGGAVTMNGGNDSTNTMYAEWGDGVVVTGGNNAINTFFDGGGNATYIGGEGDNLFVFNNLKYPTLSQGIQDNKVYPIALTNQDVTSNFEYVSKGVDTVHGNASSTENVIGLIGRLDQQTWTINLTNPADATLATDGSWVANTGQTLSGTITNNVNGAVVTFDTINKVTFLV